LELKKIFGNRIVLSILAVILSLVVIGITTNPASNLQALRNIVTIPAKYVQSFFSQNIKKINDTIDTIKEKRDLLEENRMLKERINLLESTHRAYEALKAENARLREAVRLKTKFADYEIIGGNVISKESGNWFDNFRIDKGSKDGLGSDMVVVTHDNCLIGRIYMTDYNTSMVVSIIDQTMGVSGWISKPGGGALTVKGDINLKNSGLCRVTNINMEVNIQPGDIIETSGLGGIYPKGIIIGEVVAVVDMPSLNERYALLKPMADFKRIDEVYVLKQRNEEENENAGDAS
jgi:rod shape-determining protein MreC